MNGAKAEGLAEGRARGRVEGRAEGRAEGRTEGRAEGERKKAEAMVRELLALEVETSIIVRASGLSEQEVLNLKSQTGTH